MPTPRRKSGEVAAKVKTLRFTGTEYVNLKRWARLAGEDESTFIRKAIELRGRSLAPPLDKHAAATTARKRRKQERAEEATAQSADAQAKTA